MPITVLHLIASNFLGGPERQILGHVAAVASTRVRCIVGGFLEGGGPNELLQHASELGQPTFALPAPRPWSKVQVDGLAEHLVHRQVDLLCAHGYRATVIGLPASRRAGIPLIVFARGWTAENLKVRLFQSLGGHLSRYADAVVAVSGAQARLLVRRFRIPRSRVVVVHNAIDADAFGRAVSGSEGVRPDFSVPQSAPLIVSVGRLSPEKGHRFLVYAAQRVLSRHPEARFILVGDGVERPRLERQLGKLGIGSRVTMAGFRKDVHRFLRDADLLVLPSLTEGLPNILLEAAAARRACIATNVGGNPEVIEDGVSGLLVPPADPVALAEAITSLISDDRSRRDFGARARAVVVERFRFDIQARRLGEVYAHCLARRRSQPCSRASAAGTEIARNGHGKRQAAGPPGRSAGVLGSLPRSQLRSGDGCDG